MTTRTDNFTNDSLINDSNNTVDAPAKTDISHIHQFLGARTPQAWIDAALNDLPTIIQDHANCEKKAAGTAMNLIFRYEFHQDLQLKLAQLIREEMLHYEQVVGIMQERGQAWRHLPASRYAKGMLKHKRTYEPAAMIDVLIIGAFIEARSCERFAALSAVIDDERLAKYYRYLLKSESRHYEDYITLAKSLQPKQNSLNNKAASSIDFEALKQSTHGSINSNIQTLNIDDRIAFFREVEADLITSPDNELRFHSGVPCF
ncbi:tRNA-(ms[2]io[6]A)-hydroxylase [Psychrobacter lutiphocae]|uniref:tRNA-(ms[2]io[6]A)-hydroxylase n=1 Tax=Psychrobacter lutiphocae TaxID=540500 RepID=UPI00036F4A33|nr:tRNA-(ms[2]io[6]A)-hydroxylase [Psychrobacter lutiphocae]